MLTLLQILFVVYILAVNAYGYVLVYLNKDEETENTEKTGYGKFLIAGILGGALGLFVAMFVYKFRLDSLVLMVFMPLLIVVNAFIVWELYSNNFGIYAERYILFHDFLLYKMPFSFRIDCIL